MSKTDFNIKGKVAVITGGSGVLGGSIAKACANEGARLVIIGRTQERVENRVKELGSLGAEVIGKTCDVLDVAALERISDEISEHFGRIDILVNAAGGNTNGGTLKNGQSIFDLKLSGIDESIDINLQGTIYPTIVFAKAMAEKGSGCIINISSMATFSAITRVPGYSVAKSGVEMFTKWMACEMAEKYGDKIRVNAIAPGFFIGDQNRDLLLNKDGSLTNRSRKVIAKTPMKRFGDITELNGAVQFLCSDAASFITGVVLPVDGGFSSFSGV